MQAKKHQISIEATNDWNHTGCPKGTLWHMVNPPQTPDDVIAMLSFRQIMKYKNKHSTN